MIAVAFALFALLVVGWLLAPTGAAADAPTRSTTVLQVGDAGA